MIGLVVGGVVVGEVLDRALGTGHTLTAILIAVGAGIALLQAVSTMRQALESRPPPGERR